MDLQEFLSKHVEGYMFGDLEAMSKILSNPTTGFGGGCYPMMTVCFTGIELFGGLIFPTDIRSFKDRLRTGDKWIYFESYWTDCLKEIDLRYLDLMKFFIESARNPLAHSFFTNQYISVFKNSPNDHLTEDKSNERIFFDVNKFSKDLINSYWSYVQPASKDLLKSVQMQKNLNLIINSITYKEGEDPGELLRKFFKKHYHNATNISATWSNTKSAPISPNTQTLPDFEKQSETSLPVVPGGPSGTVFNSGPSTTTPEVVPPSASNFEDK
jgi:hypothetical protein